MHKRGTGWKATTLPLSLALFPSISISVYTVPHNSQSYLRNMCANAPKHRNGGRNPLRTNCHCENCQGSSMTLTLGSCCKLRNVPQKRQRSGHFVEQYSSPFEICPRPLACRGTLEHCFEQKPPKQKWLHLRPLLASFFIRVIYHTEAAYWTACTASPVCQCLFRKDVGEDLHLQYACHQSPVPVSMSDGFPGKRLQAPPHHIRL